ncbi:MAG: TPM domain-containing protein [Clostridia bacterium]|nr:TPM domain-containing protein [Clostridia bacterium]
MKRFLLILLALLCVSLPALAGEFLVDTADLLMSYEEESLREEMAAIRNEYGLDVAIVLKNSYSGSSIMHYAADYYEAQGYGEDGLLFLLTMYEREYTTVTHGSAISIFTDYGLDRIHENITPYLSNGDYYGAMSRYLRFIRQYLEQYHQQLENGGAYDHGYSEWPMGQSLVTVHLTPWGQMLEIAPMILIGAFVIALIVALVLKSQMKSVRRQSGAASYVRDGSFHLSRVQDIYLYTTTHRRKIETNSGNRSGGGGGSSTFRSSSGGSFGGRSGRF